MNGSYQPMMTIPAPCGLAITSVASDNMYLYALQPDRKTVYKLDVCGRIICIFKLSRRYESIYICGNGRIFATVAGEKNKIYTLSRCFSESGYIYPSFPCSCNCGNVMNGCGCNQNYGGITIGPSGNCNDTQSCMFTAASGESAYILSADGRIISNVGTAGRNLVYTAIGESDGVLYEGLESSISSQTFVRATVLSTGQTKVQRLPFGYKVRSFFCYGGRLYAYVTRNSFHGYVVAVCTYLCGNVLCGEILGIADSPYDTSCCEESCSFGNCSSCKCTGGCSCGYGVSSNQTEMCSNSAVSGETTENCNIEDLCRIFNCIKSLCKDYGGCTCGSCGENCGGCGGCNNGCVGGCTSNGNCGCNGNLSCSCYPVCSCVENDATGPESCLPLPPCNHTNQCCECPPPTQSTDNLKISTKCNNKTK